MDKKHIFKLLIEEYLKNINSITEHFTDTFYKLYRESDFTDKEVEWIFGELGEMVWRYSSYLEDEKNVFYHEEDIYRLVKKIKKDIDDFKL